MLSVFPPTNQICLAPGCEKLLQEVVLEITNTETGRLDSKCSHYSFRKDLVFDLQSPFVALVPSFF